MTGIVSPRLSKPGDPNDCHAPSEDDPVLRPAGLSTREVEVLRVWLRVQRKDDAAVLLFIAPSTVSTHIARVRAKYAAVGRPARSKVSLLVRALQDGYIEMSDF